MLGLTAPEKKRKLLQPSFRLPLAPSFFRAEKSKWPLLSSPSPPGPWVRRRENARRAGPARAGEEGGGLSCFDLSLSQKSFELCLGPSPLRGLYLRGLYAHRLCGPFFVPFTERLRPSNCTSGEQRVRLVVALAEGEPANSQFSFASHLSSSHPFFFSTTLFQLLFSYSPPRRRCPPRCPSRRCRRRVSRGMRIQSRAKPREDRERSNVLTPLRPPPPSSLSPFFFLLFLARRPCFFLLPPPPPLSTTTSTSTLSLDLQKQKKTSPAPPLAGPTRGSARTPSSSPSASSAGPCPQRRRRRRSAVARSSARSWRRSTKA